MTTIEIEFDVYKALTQLRAAESVTYSDVVRELLRAHSNGHSPSPMTGRPPVVPGSSVPELRSVPTGAAWVTKNVRFPDATEFRATYKGRPITGRVSGSRLVIEGKQYDSFSQAAGDITGTSVNGWLFFECRRPGESSWRAVTSVRNGGSQR